ncbi:MAG: helix-hairpin-helix domain-containing protein, partial [Verrucomicrobiota bacterium]
MNPPTKDEIASLLESIALLLELKGENPFKIRAYTNAARIISTFPGDLALMAQEERLGEIPGIGKAIEEKITELIHTGKLPYYDELKAEFPPGLFDMFELQGLGAKKIKALNEKLGIASIEALEKACRDGSVAQLAGFGEKTATNILRSIEQRQKFAGSYRLGSVSHDAEQMLADLRDHPDVIQVSVAGSYRRRKEVVHDLDFIVSTKTPEEITRFFVTHPLVESIEVQGPTKSSVRFKTGIQADLRVVTNAQYPFALAYFTGSKEHNIAMRGRALQRGWTLNEYRLGPPEGSKFEASTADVPEINEERDLYRALGLDYVEPELREDRGEIKAAEEGKLPRLVEIGQLHGTFHCHTTASDGRSSLEEMAAEAQEIGLEYLGIADHSKSSFQAHGLDEKRLLDQVAEIGKLNRTFNGFRLFSGTECDILKDGSLDFSDEILAQLDYVVASVHSVFNLTSAEMTKRIIRAISN